MHSRQLITPTFGRLLLVSSLVSSLPAATITSGHVDVIGLEYIDEGEGFELEPHTHVEFGTIDGVDFPDNGDGYEYAAGALTVQVPGSTLSIRDSDSKWDPIGVAAGETFYFLPQSATESDGFGAPFAGIGTEELAASDWSTPVSITLTGMTGPGHFALAKVALGNPTFHMSSSDGGITAADTWSQPAGDGNHEHFNWYFTELGDYTLTFDFEATHVTDGVQTATATYSFSVVPEPSAALLGLLGIFGVMRRVRC